MPAHGRGGRLGDSDDAQVLLGVEPDRERVRERALLVDDDGGDLPGPLHQAVWSPSRSSRVARTAASSLVCAPSLVSMLFT